jgi:hypothetical protein
MTFVSTVRTGLSTTSRTPTIANVGLDELEVAPIREVSNVLAPPGRQVVEHQNAMPGADQRLAQVAADEPGTARDEERAHRASDFRADGKTTASPLLSSPGNVLSILPWLGLARRDGAPQAALDRWPVLDDNSTETATCR